MTKAKEHEDDEDVEEGEVEEGQVSTKGKKDLREFTCQYCGAVNHVPRTLKRTAEMDPVEPVHAVCGTCGTEEGRRYPPGHPNAKKPGETEDGKLESPWSQNPPPTGSVADPNANAEPEPEDTEDAEGGTKPGTKPGKPGAPKPAPKPGTPGGPGAPGAPGGPGGHGEHGHGGAAPR